MLTIYQIYCKDPEITDCYIGSSKNYERRISAHKHSCKNEKRHEHNIFLYKFIRENGGFKNWNFKILNQIEYYQELRATQEQAYINLFKPTLNVRDAGGDIDVTERTREYYKKNKEEITEKRKQYYEQNKEQVKERGKGYYEDNKNKILEKAREKRKKAKENIN